MLKKLTNDERTKKYFKNDFSQGFTLSKGLKMLFDIKGCKINSVDVRFDIESLYNNKYNFSIKTIRCGVTLPRCHLGAKFQSSSVVKNLPKKSTAFSQ